MGSSNFWLNVPSLDTSSLVYAPLIEDYTQGQLFLSLSFNNVLTLGVQVAVIILAIKLVKNCLATSSNQVA